MIGLKSQKSSKPFYMFYVLQWSQIIKSSRYRRDMALNEEANIYNTYVLHRYTSEILCKGRIRSLNQFRKRQAFGTELKFVFAKLSTRCYEAPETNSRFLRHLLRGKPVKTHDYGLCRAPRAY